MPRTEREVEAISTMSRPSQQCLRTYGAGDEPEIMHQEQVEPDEQLLIELQRSLERGTAHARVADLPERTVKSIIRQLQLRFPAWEFALEGDVHGALDRHFSPLQAARVEQDRVAAELQAQQRAGEVVENLATALAHQDEARSAVEHWQGIVDGIRAGAPADIDEQLRDLVARSAATQDRLSQRGQHRPDGDALLPPWPPPAASQSRGPASTTSTTRTPTVTRRHEASGVMAIDLGRRTRDAGGGSGLVDAPLPPAHLRAGRLTARMPAAFHARRPAQALGPLGPAGDQFWVSISRRRPGFSNRPGTPSFKSGRSWLIAWSGALGNKACEVEDPAP